VRRIQTSAATSVMIHPAQNEITIVGSGGMGMNS